MKPTPMTQEAAQAVHEHCTALIDGCNVALGKLRKIPKGERPKHVEGLIQYWKNARGAFMWAIKVANQRALSHGRQSASAIQQSRPNTRNGGRQDSG